MKIGHIISKLRYEKGYTQSELAEKLGVSKGAVAMWETDKRKPDYDYLINIANIFNVSTDYLLSRSVSTNSRIDHHPLSSWGKKIIDTFELLDEDNKDILLGEAKKLLKQQQLEQKKTSKVLQPAK